MSAPDPAAALTLADEQTNGHDSPVVTSSNLTATDLDDSTAEKLKGDAIGDTMYSQVFVLETLMKLQQMDWSTAYEDDLCFLWDMTQEPAVCRLLAELNCSSLMCAALTRYSDNARFIEIIIGILANMLAVRDGGDDYRVFTAEKEEVVIVANVLMESCDPLVLVQVMRFLHAIACRSDDTLTFFDQQLFERFNYILVNSTNADLLLQAMKVAVELTDCARLNENVISGILIKSMTTAYQTINVINNGDVNKLQIMKYVTQTICNLCSSYIDDLKIVRLIDDCNQYLDVYLQQIVDLLHDFYTNEGNLVDLVLHIRWFLYIFETLNVDYTSNLFVLLCKMLLTLNESIESDNDGSLEYFTQLVAYFVLIGDKTQIKEDLKLVCDDRGKLLNVIKDSAIKTRYSSVDRLQENLGELIL